MERNYITVTELNYYLSRIIDAEELLHNMYVLGEVSGCSIHKGNLYCTLKDENAQISIVCFAVDKTYVPENGEQVLMFGTPTYYQKTGKLSFAFFNFDRMLSKNFTLEVGKGTTAINLMDGSQVNFSEGSVKVNVAPCDAVLIKIN